MLFYMAKAFGCRPSDLVNSDMADFVLDRTVWTEGAKVEKLAAEEMQRQGAKWR